MLELNLFEKIKGLFKDTRTFGFIFLMSFSTYAITYPGFGRKPIELALTMSTSVLTDYFIRRIYFKENIFPASALISHFGIFLMCESPNLLIYPLLTFISIISKHIIKFNRKHIFNPNNFGLVLGVLFLGDQMTIVNGRWGGDLYMVFIVLLLGTFIIFRVKKNPIVISFLISFIFFGFLRHLFLHTSLTWQLMPLTGPAFIIFSFYMLTDPKTTPAVAKEQIIFGFLVAFVDCIFRIYENKYSLILSLFVMCGTYYFLKEIFLQLLNNYRLKKEIF